MTRSGFATGSTDVFVRQCEDLADFKQCIDLQQTVWGFSDLDVVPVSMFIVATKVGGQVLGAFDKERLVGFALAVSGVRGGRPYLHSNMLAVLPAYQDRGVGRALKLRQREDCLTRDIHLIEWTFDPLDIKNARFNISRMGAVIRRYLPNLYGFTSSKLHGTLPTDRLVAEWHLDSSRVKASLSGESPHPKNDVVRVQFPSRICEMRQRDPESAVRIQDTIRDQFEQWFGRAYVVTGFEQNEEHSSYLLEPHAN